MKVTFLRDKYRCGSNCGLYPAEKPGILESLRKIIDIQGSTYPEKFKEKKEDPTEYMTVLEFFKDNRPLSPGDMFLYEGQIIAIDNPDRLVLALSETGGTALYRFVEEVVPAEVELLEGGSVSTNGVEIRPETETEWKKETYESFPIPYYKMKAWRDKLGRPEHAEFPIRAILDSNEFLFPVSMWIGDWEVWYDPEEIDPEMIADAAQEVLAWTYQEGLI